MVGGDGEESVQVGEHVRQREVHLQMASERKLGNVDEMIGCDKLTSALTKNFFPKSSSGAGSSRKRHSTNGPITRRMKSPK